MLRTIWESLLFLHSVVHFDHVASRTPGQIKALQLSQFRRLLRHAARHSPYYRHKLRGLDLHRCVPEDVPILTKQEMMEHYDDIVTDPRIKRKELETFVKDVNNVGKLFLDQYAVCLTSGSQGQPAIVVQDRASLTKLFAMQAARGHSLPKTWGEVFKRVTSRKRWVIFLLRPGFFPSSSAFHYMPRPMRRFADLRIIHLNQPFEKIVEQINEIKPHFITAYVHVMENLARAELRGDLKLRQAGCLELLTSISEPLYPESRELIESTFGLKVSNHYAMGECMGLTLGDPNTGGARLNQDLAILEVRDEFNRPVPDGQPGRKVLLTNLYNFVQPIIRYEIDDIVTMRPTKDPNQPMPVIETIAGRNNDRMCVWRDGKDVEIPVFIFAAAFHPIFNLAEFQVRRDGPTHFDILLQPLPGKSLDLDEIRQSLLAKLKQEHLEHFLQFDFTVVEHIGADPKTGKRKRYVNLLKNGKGVPPHNESTSQNGSAQASVLAATV